MKLIITQGNETVAVIDDYQGPVPGIGDYIHHPRGTQPVPGLEDGFMRVKTPATWGIMARPADPETGHFVGAAEPFVELTV